MAVLLHIHNIVKVIVSIKAKTSYNLKLRDQETTIPIRQAISFLFWICLQGTLLTLNFHCSSFSRSTPHRGTLGLR